MATNLTEQLRKKFFEPVAPPVRRPTNNVIPSGIERYGTNNVNQSGIPGISQEALSKLLVSPVLSTNPNKAERNQRNQTRTIKANRANQAVIAQLLGKQMETEGSITRQKIANKGALDTTIAQNENRLAETELRNKGSLDVAGLTQKGALERQQLQEQSAKERLLSGQAFEEKQTDIKATQDKESENRKIATALISSGVDPNVAQNIYNTSGEFPVDLTGAQITPKVDMTKRYQYVKPEKGVQNGQEVIISPGGIFDTVKGEFVGDENAGTVAQKLLEEPPETEAGQQEQEIQAAVNAQQRKIDTDLQVNLVISTDNEEDQRALLEDLKKNRPDLFPDVAAQLRAYYQNQ